MRRRMMRANDQGFSPYYSDYPELTEYGTYILTPQTQETKNINTFLKLDNTPYAYAGGGTMDRILKVEYKSTGVAVLYSTNGTVFNNWIKKEQESTRMKIKRCGGSETSAPLVTFYVEKEN